MPTAELHFFHADDPNGSTIFECSTDDEFVKQIKLNIQRDSLGSGEVNFARKVPVGLFTREIVEPETLVRVLIPAVHATKYFSGFFINPRQQQVVSKDEKGGEGFTFAGPGPKHYLTRAVLWSASFSGIDSAVEKDNGVWVWPETAVAGRILERLFQEDAANPSGPFLPDISLFFDENDDSNGDPWTEDISEGNDDFTLRIATDYLKLLWQIEDASGITSQIYLGEVGDPQLRLDAYQTFGRDLTDDVAFIEGHNIRDDLDVEGSSYKKASHALMRGNDGRYEMSIRPGWSPGELKKVIGGAYETDSAVVLDQAGKRLLQRQQNGEKQIDLRIVTGFAPTQGRYFPGPDYSGSNGDFWVGDTVSLTTGQSNPTELDYQDEEEVVTGIELELNEAVRDDNDERRARSFDVTLNLNEERKSSNSPVDLAGNRGTTPGPAADISFCRVTIPPGPDTPGSPVLILTWNFTSTNLDNGTGTYDLMATRSSSAGSLPGTWGWNGGGSTNPQIAPRVPIIAGQGLRIQGTFSKQLAMSLQTSHIDVAFYTAGAGGHIAGADVVVPIPASGAGLGVTAAVDELLIAPATATHCTIAPYRNLYGDDITLTVTAAPTPGTDPRSGAGLEELVGSGSRAAHCNHAHHVFRDEQPTAIDDDEHGYPVGTSWIIVDDVDNPTEILGRYRLLDSTNGAAVWAIDISLTPETSTLRWEPVTNGEDVFVWQADDLVLEFKDYA